MTLVLLAEVRSPVVIVVVVAVVVVVVVVAMALVLTTPRLSAKVWRLGLRAVKGVQGRHLILEGSSLHCDHTCSHMLQTKIRQRRTILST